MKILLLITTSVLALTAGAASAASSLPPMIKVPHAAGAFHLTPRHGSKILYDQAYSSGLSAYAMASALLESPAYTSLDSQGADDFVLPGTTKHRITAVYAPGVNAYGTGYTASNFQVTFYRKITSGTSGKILKTCASAPASDLSGDGDVMIDVSACGLKAKGGKDLLVSVQAITPSGRSDYNFWYWQMNKKQIGTEGWWQNYGGAFGMCPTYEPLHSCQGSSYLGPDLAFAIIGK